MDGILEKLKNLKSIQLGSLFGGGNKSNNAEPRAKEINLVPDIKDDFIKALKLRNFIFFLCIVVSISSTVVILIFLSIAGGQQGFISAKQSTIDALQKKIEDYSDLSDFLTIRDQLNNIAAITENKTAISRSLNILSAIIPTGADTISISKLSVDLAPEESEYPIFDIEAQANAGTSPYIDYKVLDAFKKSMDYMRYDYGEYVDKDDQTIPAYCMVEKAADGSFLYDSAKGYYGYWLIEGEGCNTSAEEESEETSDQSENDDSSKATPLQTNPLQSNPLQSGSSSSILGQVLGSNPLEGTLATPEEPAKVEEISGYPVIDYEGQKVVQIWRTPQYNDWYKEDPKEDEAHMTLDGEIHNIPHFNSACTKYSGVKDEASADKKIIWSATNDTCLLVPPAEAGEEGESSGGITIPESRNGREEEDGELVLRFNAIIAFNPEVFNFNNHHLIVTPPSGRRNVTDSYVQIQSIFAKRAKDCSKDDRECNDTPTGASNSKPSGDDSGDDSDDDSGSNSNPNNNGEEDDEYDEDYYEEEDEE